jgi:hypothetical protein
MSELKLDPRDLGILLQRIDPALAFEDGEVRVRLGGLALTLGEADLRARLRVEVAGLAVEARTLTLGPDGADATFHLGPV